MSKKFPGLLILFIIICLITSCGHDRSAKIELKKVTADFSALTKKVDAEAKIAATRDKKQEMLAESQEGFNNLLKRIADLPASPGLEILRAKILLRLDRLAESEQVIDSVLNSNPAADIINGARVVKVLVLIAQAKTAAAYEIFKDIDPGSLDPVDYYTALFQLALEHEDDETREKCSVQFLNAKELPVEQDGNLYIIQANLAELATIEGDLDKAKSILDEGIKETNVKSEAFL